MCLNYVQGGKCYATGGECLLGLSGQSAKNTDMQCGLHGNFDVWVTQNDDLLISDMQFPSSEPKQCLALGVSLRLARKVARERAQKPGARILTTKRRCYRCGKSFWISQHRNSSGLFQSARGYLCPICIHGKIGGSIAKRLGVLRDWCG